jgi:hypothetical protein
MEKYYVNHDLFIINHNPISVYILGLLWADGYVNKKNNQIVIECIGDDIDYFYTLFSQTGNYGLYNRKNRKTKTIYSNCYELSTFLKENNYTNKSFLTSNKILSNIDKNLHKYFFLGWFDGDGCIYSKNTCNQLIITGGYEQKWGDLTEICKELGIESNIRLVKRVNNSYSQIRITNMGDIICFGDYMYNNHNIGLKRKKDKFLSVKDKYNTFMDNKKMCYDKENNLICDFSSLKEASLWLNKKRNVSGDINDCIRGRQKTAFGYIWKK